MRIRYPLVFAPLLLSLTMGSTECESFETVTVPSTDTSKPIVVDGVFWAEWLDQEVSTTGNSLVYHVDIPHGEQVFAISSAVDSSGLKKLTTSSEKVWTCCQGSICSGSSTLGVPYVETQPGSVGSSVSTGIWKETLIDKLPTCPSGKTLKAYRYSWWTTGENYHGGKTTGQKHSIVWP